jgi:predicted RNA-binding protein
MDGSLRELAESKAASNPELAEALSMIPRYFVTDERGQPRSPANPARVIF